MNYVTTTLLTNNRIKLRLFYPICFTQIDSLNRKPKPLEDKQEIPGLAEVGTNLLHNMYHQIFTVYHKVTKPLGENL